MKNILRILLLILLFTSCEDFLKEDPRGFISPTSFFNNYAECKIAVNGCYDQISNAGNQNGNYWQGYYQPAIMADEMQWDPLNGNAFKELSNCQFTPSTSPIYDTWNIGYKIVNTCNLAIDGIENSSITGAQKTGLIAEAKFIRALFYFHLANFFGDVPLLLKPTLTVNGNNVAREDAKKVFAAIIDDLKYAETNLPLVQTEVGRVTSGAAKTLLAKVYMQLAGYPYNDASKWQLALDKCKEIISQNTYVLLPNYDNVFKLANENSKEVIFDIQYTLGLEGSGLGTYFYGFTGSGTYGGSGTQAFLIKEFAQSFKTGDLRRNWVVGDFNISATGVTTKIADASKWRNAKYRQEAPVNYLPTQGPLNFIVLRYADVLLMCAEAINEINNGPTDEAYGYINTVRRRGYGVNLTTPNNAVDLIGLDKSAFFNALINERSWELAGEGYRFYDLKRWHLLLERIKATSSMAVASIQEKHYSLPVPFKEMLVNPNLVQTPAWQ